MPEMSGDGQLTESTGGWLVVTETVISAVYEKHTEKAKLADDASRQKNFLLDSDDDDDDDSAKISATRSKTSSKTRSHEADQAAVLQALLVCKKIQTLVRARLTSQVSNWRKKETTTFSDELSLFGKRRWTGLDMTNKRNARI